MKNRYAKVFAILKSINAQPGVNLSYSQVVKEFTDGRSESLTDLSDKEVQELEKRLQSMAPQSASEKNDKTRKAIISQFLSIGKTTSDAIAWAEKYGVQGKKRGFNEYNGQELYILLQNAKKMKEQVIKSINRIV